MRNLIHIDDLKRDYEKIHYFGLGFIQLKVNDNLRYHFYHPELKPIVPDEEIHNHRYPFISTILAGEFTQSLFEVIETKDRNTEFYLVEDDCTETKSGDRLELGVYLRHVKDEIFIKGQSYLSLPEEFHTVKTNFAITRLYRGDFVSEKAKIVKRRGVEEVCPFSVKMSETQCWEIVNGCIDMM